MEGAPEGEEGERNKEERGGKGNMFSTRFFFFFLTEGIDEMGVGGQRR